MKRTLAFIAVTAMLAICIVPMMDSSDADATPTTITSYFYNDSKDISTAKNINISIIYYKEGDPAGTVVGKTNVIDPKDPTTGSNMVSINISLTGTEDLTWTCYYYYISMDGFSVKSTPHSVNSETTDVTVTEGTGQAVKKCYRITETGSLTLNTNNLIGDADKDIFTIQSAFGTVTGVVKINNKEPTYLNGVKISLYDIVSGDNLTSTYSGNDGYYSIQYNTGEYGVRYELNGYDTIEKRVSIGQGSVVNIDTDMTQNSSYFGLDLPHVLMILGGAAAIVLLLFAVFMRYKVSKR